MSVQLFGEDTLFLQRFLQGAGFYTAELDGIYGEKTDAAVNAFEEKTQEIAEALGKFDSRSERNIGSLQPKAQEAARRFLKRIRDEGIDARIISGTRTYAEQNTLFRQGRYGNPGPRVSNARGGPRAITISVSPGISAYSRTVLIWGIRHCTIRPPKSV